MEHDAKFTLTFYTHTYLDAFQPVAVMLLL